MQKHDRCLRRYAHAMAIRLRRLTARLGAEIGDLTPALGMVLVSGKLELVRGTCVNVSTEIIYYGECE